MTATEHELPGLEPDNLLAFLALLGLLRALETARPEWQPRMAWRGTPPTAVLTLAADAAESDITAAADDGLHAYEAAYGFDRTNITYTAKEFRALARAARTDSSRARIAAALASDGVCKRRSDDVAATPLCAMFGQGHQHFLARLHNAVANGVAATDDGKLCQALFEPWRHDDTAEGFRWDPVEDRRYALQFGNPSDAKNKMGTVWGANRLAALGFGEFACAPGGHGLLTIGVDRRGHDQFICWPIAGVPTGLAGYRAVLASPDLMGAADRLAPYGVRAVARARRFQNGKFFNFERARIEFL